MANGIPISPTEPLTKDNSTTGFIFKKEGNICSIRCDACSVRNDGYVASIPSDYRPTESIFTACVISRSTSPTHVVGYVALSSNGLITCVEPYNGTYRFPSDGVCSFQATFIQG